MKAPALNSLPRLLLAALASLGMILPSAARPCCSCCSSHVSLGDSQDDVSQDDATPSCCSKRPSCCLTTTNCCSPTTKTTTNLASRSCCQSAPKCGGPKCRCYVLPAKAIPSEAPVKIQRPEASESCGLTMLSERVPPVASLASYRTSDAVPHRCGSSRLHSWLCVWLN